MNMLDRMNMAIEYIEEHITEEIDFSKLAKISCCSSYNFQRMFSFISDVSVVEYVRHRRMTLAALELQEKGAKVINIAMKYGYESPVSFARAFKAIHGITPSEAKKTNISLIAFPKMTFQITIKGVSEMSYRIVKTKKFKVFGLEGIVSTVGDDKYFSNEGEIWQENHHKGKYEQLVIDAGDEKPLFYDEMFVKEMCKVHALMNYKKINDTTYAYMQCSFIAPDSKTDGYTIEEIPETTWAVFSAPLVDWNVGSAMTMLNKRFYTEWLPTSDYEKADAPEFEMYGGTPSQGYIELWMPIVRKKDK